MKTIKLNKKIIAENEERIDKYLSTLLTISRSKIQNLIKKGNILVNDKLVKTGYILNKGDIINIDYEEAENSLKPSDLGLEVLYEDEYLAVINKPIDLVMHKGANTLSPTLVEGLMYQFKNLSNLENDPNRLGLIHRLDKDTSGCLIVMFSNQAHKILKKDFQNRKIKKEYEAILVGSLKNDYYEIDLPIKRHEKIRTKMAVYKDGRKALTKINLINKTNKFSYVKLDLITGRTHQIRVHTSHLGYPILGDTLYGNEKQNETKIYLHAKKIEFIHPITKQKLSIIAKLPKRFNDKLINLGLI